MTSDRNDWWRLGTSAARLVPQLPHMARALPYLLDTPIMRATDLGTAVERTASRFPERRAIWSEHATYTWRAVDTISNRQVVPYVTKVYSQVWSSAYTAPIDRKCSTSLLPFRSWARRLRFSIPYRLGGPSPQRRGIEGRVYYCGTRRPRDVGWHHVCELNTLYAAAQHESAAQIDDISAPERSDAAFYIFTSGTTDSPKRV